MAMRTARLRTCCTCEPWCPEHRWGSAPTRAVLSLAILAGGCAPAVLLPDVPITGGTPTEREIARTVMLAFDEDVGPGRVTLESLAFDDPGDENLGRFGRRRITIRPGLDERVVGRIVRHELCHALDIAESLSKPTPAAVRDLVFTVESLDVPSDEGETLAAYCELGPYPARVMADPCPGDDARVTAMARWLVDTIWTESDDGYQLAPAPAGLELPVEPAFVKMSGARELFGEGHTEQDLHTTARVEYTTEEEPDPPKATSVRLDDGSPGPPFWEISPLFDTGDTRDLTYDETMISFDLDARPQPTGIWVMEDLSAVGFFVFARWDPMDLSAPRASISDEEGWSNVTGGCVQPGQGLFATADGTFWSSWVEGDVVRWGSFVRED